MSFPGRIQSELQLCVLSPLSIPSTGGSSARQAENPDKSAMLTPAAKNQCSCGSIQPTHSGKENALSPTIKRSGFPSVRRVEPRRRRTSSPASLTVEAALELPLFFLCMMLILHLSVVFRAAAEFSGRMTQAAEQLSLFAYSRAYEDSNHLLRGALSDVWVHSQVIPKAADREAIQHPSFLLSSFLKEDSRISLVLTYQIKAPVSVIRLPWKVFVQKITIRGFTGRKGVSGEKGGEDSVVETREVYVTDSGTVYHTDADCSHLKLTVAQITRPQLKTVRNYKGSIYKSCRYCGSKNPGSSTVLVNPYGDAWHTSSACPGLKRSIRTVHADDVHDLRECLDCAKRRTAA